MEGFSPGEGLYAALGSLVVVHRVQLQAAAAPLVFRLPAAAQLVPSAGHGHQAHVGPGQNPVEPGHLDVGFQHDLVLPRHSAVGGVGQGPDQGPLLLRLLPLVQLGADPLPCPPVGVKPGEESFPGGSVLLLLCVEGFCPGLQRRQVLSLLRRELVEEGLYPGLQLGGLVPAFLIVRPGSGQSGGSSLPIRLQRPDFFRSLPAGGKFKTLPLAFPLGGESSGPAGLGGGLLLPFQDGFPAPGCLVLQLGQAGFHRPASGLLLFQGCFLLIQPLPFRPLGLNRLSQAAGQILRRFLSQKSLCPVLGLLPGRLAAGLGNPRSLAGLGGFLLCLLSGAFLLLYHLLGGRFLGQHRRGRVVPGAAHRAGLPCLQKACQIPGLTIQKGPFCPGAGLAQRLGPVRSGPVLLQRLLPAILQGLVPGQQIPELVQVPVPAIQSLPLSLQPFCPLVQALQAVPLPA